MKRQNGPVRGVIRRQDMRGSVKLPPLGTRLVPPPGGVGVSSDFELLGANLRNGSKPQLPSISAVTSPRKESKQLDNETHSSNKSSKLSGPRLKPLPAIKAHDDSVLTILYVQDRMNEAMITDQQEKSIKVIISEHRERGTRLLAEFQVAQADADVTQQSVLLQQLGDVHINLAKYGKDDMDFIRGISFYNAALQRTNSQTQPAILTSRVTAATQMFLSSKSIRVVGKDKLTTRNKHKELLRKIRSKIHHTNKNIIDKYTKFLLQNTDVTENIKKEESMISDVKKLSNNLTTEMTNVLKTVWLECIAIAGRPPCSYCIITLGEHARKLVSPYSSIEFAILLEDGQEDNQSIIRYFSIAVILFNIKILNLGETPLTSIGMQLFNDFYNKSMDCFPDVDMIDGLSINFGRRCASVSPMHLLRKNNNVTSSTFLLKSPMSLSAYLIETGYRELELHAFNAFLSVAFIEGDINLMKDYENHMTELIKLPPPISSHNSSQNDSHKDSMKLTSLCKRHGNEMLRELMKPHIFSDGADIGHPDGNIAILLETKKCIYDFGKVVHSLGLICGISAVDSWKTIEQLLSRNRISSGDAHHLRVALSISTVLRIQENIFNKGCGGLLRLLTHNKTNEMLNDIDICRVLHTTTDTYAFRFFYTAIPLVQHMSKCNHQITELSFTTFTGIYEQNATIKAQIFRKFLQYTEAIVEHKNAQEKLHSKDSNKTNTQDLCESHANLGFLYLLNNQSREANNCFTKLLELKEELEDVEAKSFCFVKSWYYLGVLYFMDGKYDKCIAYLREALDMHQDIFGDKGHQEFTAKAYHLLGRVFSILGRFRESIDNLNIVNRYNEHIEGPGKCSPRAYAVLTELADAYIHITDYKTAHGYARQALASRRIVQGVNVIDPCLAHSLDQLSRLSHHFGKAENSALYIKQALTMRIRVCGKEAVINPESSETMHVETIPHLISLAKSYEAVGVSDGAFKIIDYMTNRLSNNIQVNICFPLKIKLAYCQAISLSSTGKFEESRKLFNDVMSMMHKMFGDHSISLLLSECLDNMAAVSISLGLYANAIDHTEEALAMTQAIVGEHNVHPNLANILHRLATIQIKQGDIMKAVDYHMQAVDVFRKVYGLKKPHPDVAKALRCVGLAYVLTNDYSTAVNYLNQSVTELHRCHGQDKIHPAIATVQEDIGQCYMNMEEYETAEKAFLDVLRIRESLYGAATPHIDTINSMMKLADLYAQLNKYSESMPLHQKAFDLSKCLAKKGRHCQMRSSWMLGRGYLACCQYADALQMIKFALNVKRSILGSTGVDIEMAEILSDLAQCHEHLKDAKEAALLQKQSLEVRRKVLGPDAVDSNMITSMLSLAAEQEEKANYEKASTLFRQVIHKSRQLKNNEATNANITLAMHSLINIYNTLGEYEKSHSFCRQLLELLRRTHKKSPDHPSIATCLRKYAVAYTGMGHYNKSVELITQALDMMKKIHKTNTKHPDVIACLGELGYALHLSGQSEQGLNSMKNALKTMKENTRKTVKDREDIAQLLYKVGSASEGLGKYKQAIDYYNESLKVRKELRAGKPQSLDIAQSLHALGRANAGAGNYDKGIQYMEDAIRMEKSCMGTMTANQHTVNTFMDLGSAYDKNGSPQKAIRAYGDALRMLKGMYSNGKANLRVAHCLTALAAVCRKARQYGDAIQHCQETIDIHKQIYSQNTDHPVVASTYGMLGELYLEAGRYPDAVTYLKLSSQMLLSIHDGNASHTEVQGVMKLLQDAKNSTETVLSVK